MITLLNGKCEEEIKNIKANTITLIYFNPPFKFFDVKWDKNHLDYKVLWNEMWRVLKPNGCVVIHSAQSFTGYLINTQSKHFRYFYTWIKSNKSNFLQAKYQPLRQTEEVCVFYKKQPVYNPQMIKKDKPVSVKGKGHSKLYARLKGNVEKTYTHSYPTNILLYPIRRAKLFNRPQELTDFIVNTYTNEKDTVLDLTMGDGITGISCKDLKRKYIGIDVCKEHFELCKNNLTVDNL